VSALVSVLSLFLPQNKKIPAHLRRTGINCLIETAGYAVGRAA